MRSKNLKQLRELAKRRGLTGYSKLTKEELLKRLEAAERRTPANAAKPQPAPEERAARIRTTSIETEKPIPSTTPAAAPTETPWWEPPREMGPADQHYASEEELVEGAKYDLVRATATALPTLDLGEDIDRLPEPTEPTLCLLPQKPGILHAYWLLPRDAYARAELKLRLCRGEPTSPAVWQELGLPAERGTWYFHVPEHFDNERERLSLEIGHYRDGEFVRAMQSVMSHLPSRYASEHIDRAWPVGEEDFRHMYLRAGGFESPAGGYGWSAAIGSPGGPAPVREERFGWPGGVSSR